MSDWVLIASSALLAILLLSFIIGTARVKRSGRLPAVRALPALDALRSLTDRAIEEGRATHVALGTGTVAGEHAVETIIGLTVMSTLAAQARRANQIPVVTTADPVVQLLAGNVLTQEEDNKAARDFARFIAPDGVAYGAGTRTVMRQEQLGLTAVLGDIGDEYLFVAADQPGGGSHFHAPEVAGTTRPEVLPLVYMSARNPLLGEELFAYGAYLGKSALHWAGVMTQDAGRYLVVVLIVVGTIVVTFMGLR